MKYDTCLIKTDSLDQILQLKYQLDEQGIPYREKIRSGSSLRDFGALLFITGQGSYGTNGERQTTYELFVSKEDYERAQQLIRSCS
ncbi:hypothetical protein [Claveliimonas sp.]|uniref:hypothetical protein n=1 Tax=Claveliimonas sp. TaxID=3076672 RepID=UPI00307BF1F5